MRVGSPGDSAATKNKIKIRDRRVRIVPCPDTANVSPPPSTYNRSSCRRNHVDAAAAACGPAGSVVMIECCLYRIAVHGTTKILKSPSDSVAEVWDFPPSSTLFTNAHARSQDVTK